MKGDRFISTRQAARLLHIGQSTAQKWVAAGLLRGYQIPGHKEWYINKSHVLELAAHESPRPAAWIYLDEIGIRIQRKVHPAEKYDPNLYRLYALLCVTTGELTMGKDVHDAWAIWAAVYRSRSLCLIPYEELSPEYQAMDEPYAEAIRQVALEDKR